MCFSPKIVDRQRISLHQSSPRIAAKAFLGLPERYLLQIYRIGTKLA